MKFNFKNLNKFVKKLTKFRLLKIFGIIIFLLSLIYAWMAIYSYSNPIPTKQEREEENTKQNIVSDVTELYKIKTKGIVVVHTQDEIVEAIKSYDHVSIGGGRNSMGGQTASSRAIQIDMREYNKVLSFSTTSKEITVQSGIRWRDIQDYIDPYNLSVKIMQTYSNFTVGGSLSVNVHGRYIGLGPIILSVKGFTIILSDGSVVRATPTEHADIFYSAIGGMGGIGVISDVTLELADNVNVERSPTLMDIGDYHNYFMKNIRDDKKVIFHNGDIYPPDFDKVRAVSWIETDKSPTTEDRLIPRAQDYWLERIAWLRMSEWPMGRYFREYIIDPLIYMGEQPVHTRNYEASYDIAELEPESRDKSTYVLQEYFIPVDKFDVFIPKMKEIFNRNNVNVINVSIRHALADSGSKLAWAKKECFAFVVYYKQGTDEKSKESVSRWTKQMIDAAITLDGSYYLPYQPHASDEQFYLAYPGALEYFEIKKTYDPNNKFTNNLWDIYYNEDSINKQKSKLNITNITKNIVDYRRNPDDAYIGIPEWFIVYNSAEYAKVLRDTNPSDFKYFSAIAEYWREYGIIKQIQGASYRDNSDYLGVLKVIGISYSVELTIKGVYENTFGKLFEYFRGEHKVCEEDIMSDMNEQYAKFIYYYPWYDFNYSKYLISLWGCNDNSGLTFGGLLRKIERLGFSSKELTFKIVYSKLIAYATHSKFGVQSDITNAIIQKNGELVVVSAPHYQSFSDTLLSSMQGAVQSGDDKYEVLEIAGNDSIVISFLTDSGIDLADMNTVYKEILRNNELGKVRIHAEVKVKELFTVYKMLNTNNINIDHIYDY